MSPRSIWSRRVLPALLTVALCAAALVSTAGRPAAALTTDQHLRGARIEPSTVFVRFAPGTTPSGRRAALDRHRVAVRPDAKASRSGFVAVATGGRDPRALQRAITAERSVAAVELDLRRQAADVPNDPRYVDGSQGYLDEVRLPDAWTRSKGGSDVTIAVLDTGVSATHPDLLGRVLPGRDFVDDDFDASDEEGHGTQVAGMAAASTNNAVGIAGAAWNATILPVRVLDETGAGTDQDVADGIRWAISQGADIINLSLGGYGSTTYLQDAVADAVAANIVVVAAAGNLGADTLFKEPVYPAAHQGVVGVGATDHDGRSVSFTLHGPWVDLAAPGLSVLMTSSDGGYGTNSGTSFAAPMVAGVAALVRAASPTMTAAAVATRLQDTATDVGLPGRDDVYGAGLLDAAAAVGSLPRQAARTPAPGDGFEPNDTASRASALGAATTIAATIAPEGEVDWYAVSVPSSTRLLVSLDPPDGGDSTHRSDLILRLWTSSGRLIVERDALGTGGVESLSHDSATAGTYLVQVENFLPTLGPGPYSLTTSTVALGTPTTTAPTTSTTSPPTAQPPAPAPPPPAPAPAPNRSGYWMVSRDGSVYAFGDAPHHGNAPGLGTMAAVDLEPTPDLSGYWITTDTGHVYTFGSAPHLGALNGALGPGERVTSISAVPSGRGYWLFTTSGRVVGFGDAAFLGDMSGTRLNGPVLDSIPTPSGRGYFMVASDGGIFTFGDAVFAGSMGGIPLNAPVQSLVPDRDGSGYWLVASDGGIFSFEALFRGSTGDVRLNGPITGMVRFGDGYLMVGTDGGIFNFSDREFHGSLGAAPPPTPIVAVAAAEG